MYQRKSSNEAVMTFRQGRTLIKDVNTKKKNPVDDSVRQRIYLQLYPATALCFSLPGSICVHVSVVCDVCVSDVCV